jgi:PAS domain S-box-containing protein
MSSSRTLNSDSPHLPSPILLATSVPVEDTDVAARRLAAIVESSDDAIVSKDLTGIVTSWNSAAERIFGYKASEIVGRHITTIIPPELHVEEKDILARIRRGDRLQHFETVRVRKDGVRIKVSLTISPVKDGTGRIIGASKIARDISERKRIQDQQQVLFELIARVNRAEALPDIFEAAFDAIRRSLASDREAILLNDATGQMQFRAWRGLSEEYRKAVAGHSPWRQDESNAKPIFIPDVREANLPPDLRDIVLGEGIRALAFVPLTYENRLLGKFMMYYNSPRNPLPDESKFAETIASQVAFATVRHQAEEKLEALVAERTASLRAAIAQMEEFSYSVSHDLRSPLRAMQGYAHALVEDYGDKLDATAREYLDRIERGGTRMDRLIQDLLTYSRLTRREVEIRPVSLQKLTEDLIAQYVEMQAPFATVEIKSPLLPVMGHEPSLSQVLTNLLSNAVKFTKEGQKPDVQVWTERVGNVVRLSIQDNGIGIKPEHHHRLFGMFERIHPEDRFEGTGIGLAIVRKAVDRMNGRVGVESDGENGSRFWVELPAAPV